MGIFGPSKIKITPADFANTQLEKLFSHEFADEERKNFAQLSMAIPLLHAVSLADYLRERQNVICGLLQIAWDRTLPYPVFIRHAGIMKDDPRVKGIDSGIYDRCLSRAQEAGMSTFGFIAKLFIARILPEANDPSDPAYNKLHIACGTDFTSRYIFYEALIKRHKFIST